MAIINQLHSSGGGTAGAGHLCVRGPWEAAAPDSQDYYPVAGAGHYTHGSACTEWASRCCACALAPGAGAGGSPCIWLTVETLNPVRTSHQYLDRAPRCQRCTPGCTDTWTAGHCTSYRYSRTGLLITELEHSFPDRTSMVWCGAWPWGSPMIASMITMVFSREIISD